MTTGTLSFNEIAAIMGLTRRTLKMFCEHKARSGESAMVTNIYYARTNKERDRVDEAEFYLWLSSRGRHSPNGLPQDRVRQFHSGQTTDQQLCNSAEFAAFRKGLIDAGWFEKSDSYGLEYLRGNDRIDLTAYYTEEHWSDRFIDRRAYTYLYITGTVPYEKQRYLKYSSFEEFVPKTMAKMFDRKPAALNGLSFREWALAPVAP
jgi:hypothetical protein